MLETRSLQFSYDASRQFTFPDLQADQAEPLLILGQSGVGKTTLLHLLGGLLRPRKGQILVGDTDISQLPDQALDQFRGRHIGVVFQQAHFVQALSVEKNLELTSFLANKPLDRPYLKDLLSRLGISDRMHQRPHRLSVGEQQRVSIARAVLNRPTLLLADEPTSALDDQHAEKVIHLLQETAEEAHATLVIVTHDHRLKAHMSQQVLLKASTPNPQS